MSFAALKRADPVPGGEALFIYPRGVHPLKNVFSILRGDFEA
jgi:hypothetical protein